jgi:hypothetical protein
MTDPGLCGCVGSGRPNGLSSAQALNPQNGPVLTLNNVTQSSSRKRAEFMKMVIQLTQVTG